MMAENTRLDVSLADSSLSLCYPAIFVLMCFYVLSGADTARSTTASSNREITIANGGLNYGVFGFFRLL